MISNTHCKITFKRTRTKSQAIAVEALKENALSLFSKVFDCVPAHLGSSREKAVIYCTLMSKMIRPT